MSITAAMVKELRERTGAGMMECKKALQETNGDLEAAITEMRKRGQAKAAKRAGKIAAEGIIAIKTSGQTACMIEVNCETDFVARSEGFRTFVDTLVQRGLDTKATDSDALLTASVVEGKEQTLEQMRQENIVKMGENLQLRRVATLSASGSMGVYQHGDRIGVLVALDVDNSGLAKDVAMHIAAAHPQAIAEDEVPDALVAKERDIFSAQAKESGKPDSIIEKMVEGRIGKFLKEICLVHQAFVKNPDQTVGDLLASSQAKVIGFVRFEVGEGIEKQTQNFAEEVRAQIGEKS